MKSSICLEGGYSEPCNSHRPRQRSPHWMPGYHGADQTTMVLGCWPWEDPIRVRIELLVCTNINYHFWGRCWAKRDHRTLKCFHWRHGPPFPIIDSPGRLRLSLSQVMGQYDGAFGRVPTQTDSRRCRRWLPATCPLAPAWGHAIRRASATLGWAVSF